MNVKRTILLIVGIVMGAPAWAEGAAQESWQLQVLWEPTQGQLDREARGAVMIYDGLTDKQVEQAMEVQFERIDSMMFIRTVETDEEGEPVVDEETGEPVTDDDC